MADLLVKACAPRLPSARLGPGDDPAGFELRALGPTRGQERWAGAQAATQRERSLRSAASRFAASARRLWCRTSRGDWSNCPVAAKTDEVKAKIDKRTRQLDAPRRSKRGGLARGRGSSALDFADSAVVNAQLAVLDAVDARVYADALAEVPGS